jgi:hypothetical protein
LVVQAYCAVAGCGIDNARKPALSAGRYRNPFMTGFPADIVIDIILSSCKQSLPGTAC